MKYSVEEINNLTDQECYDTFQNCCTASSWVAAMVYARPFANVEDLKSKSDGIWSQVDYEGWIEACEGHPKIGDVDSLAKKYASTKQWAGNEQQGMDSADMEVIEALAKGNEDYEHKFGYIFIVCATGKSASEMLEILNSRLPNEPKSELDIARGEQNKITRIRLDKLIEQ